MADFGLAMSVYDQLYFRQDASDSIKLPIKWLAIESIEDGVFSEKTDVVQCCVKINSLLCVATFFKLMYL